jgi:hypothetical protein
MRNKALPALLVIVLIGVFSTHVSLKKEDNGWLMYLDARAVDLPGKLSNSWTRLVTQCKDTQKISKNDPLFTRLDELIKNYSPPDSQSALVASIIAKDDWALAEVEFTKLLPAVVTIQSLTKNPQIKANGVWSGYTQPWESAPIIRTYIKTQIPDLPTHLVDCFEPQSSSFK